MVYITLRDIEGNRVVFLRWSLPSPKTGGRPHISSVVDYLGGESPSRRLLILSSDAKRRDYLLPAGFTSLFKCASRLAHSYASSFQGTSETQ